jgi:peptidyl-prolyl cis-trans isomerase C
MALILPPQYPSSMSKAMFPAQRGKEEPDPVGAFTSIFFSCCLGAVVLLGLPGCRCDSEESSSGAESRDSITGLTPAEAKEVLVTVGTRAITLGDYVATLSRMDQFERLRYQTEERQKALLDEMIEVELLAQEAERRGLDKDPEVQLRLQKALRDELLRLVEARLPALEEISEREVRAYYDAHRSEFQEPERRRVLLIKVGSQSVADEVLQAAQGATGQQWAELARKYSLEHATAREGDPEEFAGDVGFVSPPGEERGANNAVPDEARKEVFGLKKIGDVALHAVSEGKYFYIVRLGGISPARDRTISEADRAIRVELRRQKFLQAEKDYEAELRKKYPVKIDEQALLNFRASPSQGAAGKKTAPQFQTVPLPEKKP